MLSFLATHPPRTKIAHLNSISFDEGRSSVEFKSPADDYLVINRLPPLGSEEDVAHDEIPNWSNCVLAPPLHWHHSQEETFHVLEGTAIFTLNGAEKVATAGEVVIIPKRDIHTFRNGSEETELVVEFVLDPSTRKNDEAYFRNIWAYRDDCRKAGIPPSLFQVLLFMYEGQVVMNWPGPRFVAKPFGFLMNIIGGLVVGKWILGYSACYAEYCHPQSE
ncbi:hypothetical protein F5884DRAFT_780575 [Xylogone sp. PMI_703]|nr:hypothetical protein F5884DRAFT_780575 [Xylogone sp. PMI_703]